MEKNRSNTVKYSKSTFNNSTGKNKTYGPNHFAIPSMDRKLEALDLKNLNKTLQEQFTAELDKFYKDIQPPIAGDWLWQHKEVGQKFKTYITGIINQPSKSHNTIYIKNLDEGIENSFLDQDIIEHLRQVLELYYPGINVKLFQSSDNLESWKISNRFNYYHQYHSGEVIQKLCKLIPKDGLLIIGLTSFDLYPRDDWNFVFGLASTMDGCGLFSLRRYYDEISQGFTGGEKEFRDALIGRSVGVMVHETGHLFGMRHCIYFSCVMNGSNNHKENKDKPFELCPVCLRKIQANLKFDIIKRFENLAEGLKKINEVLYSKQIEWYKDRAEFLKELEASK